MRKKGLFVFIVFYLGVLNTQALANLTRPAQKKFENILETLNTNLSEENLNKQISNAEFLIKSGAIDVNEKGSLGYRYLNAEVIKNNLPAVKFLVKHGAVLKPSDYIDTLGYAVLPGKGGFELLKYLIEEFKVDFSKPEYNELGIYLLEKVIRWGEVENAKVLAELVDVAHLKHVLGYAKTRRGEVKSRKPRFFNKEARSSKKEEVKRTKAIVSVLEEELAKRNCQDLSRIKRSAKLSL